MKYEKVLLKDLVNNNVGEKSFVEVYKADETEEIPNAPHPAMVILPGGAYEICSRREAEPVAIRFVSEGFVVFVLSYTCRTAYPLPYYEVAHIFNLINRYADEYLIDTKRISLMGFSAGGHLAASYSLIYKEIAKTLNYNEEEIRPFANVLCYPVTSLIINTNSTTRDNITGGKEELINKLTVPENVTNDYPPTFIWTTKVDACVPPIHSTSMFEALNKLNVPCELVMFENGIHGGSLANRAVYAPDFDFKSILENRSWVDKAVEFIYNI